MTFPKPGDTVSMHYTGTLTSGAKFDSSRDRGKEFSTAIGVGQVIQGWDQGVPQMTLGEHAILRISAACGYGVQGSPPVIPPNSDLVFDVQLNGLNGRRAGSPVAAAPMASFAPPAPVTLPSSFAPQAPSAGSLPRCVASSQCGHAISFDLNGNSRPLCLCNPICQEMRGTPGVLPCCPGLQETCLDPYREPTPAPLTASIAASAPINAVASFAPAAPAAPVATFAAAITAPITRMPSDLPTCRVNSCGKAMAMASAPTKAACACDVSCLAIGSSLPCCQAFAEVCQAPRPLATAGVTASLATSAPATQLGTPCNIGQMQWAEQPACDKKRWAMQGGKCKKVCPAIDMGMGIVYYPTGSAGKNACQAAVSACRG